MKEYKIIDFNPRSRMGSDINATKSVASLYDFNPRSRMGSDGMYYEMTFNGDRFQSTLPYGERPGG